MMKKLLAVALALAIALTCTLALAETVNEVEYPAFQGLTVQSEYDMDRDVLKDALTKLGLDESLVAIADTVASVISEVSEKAVIATDGAQYELSLKDTALISVVGQMSEAGITLATSLVPSYVLSVSMDDLAQLAQGFENNAAGLQNIDMDALSEAISGHMSEFVNVCTQSVVTGEPEEGDYVLDGISYNYKVPINVDVAAITNASSALFTNLANDETVKSAIETMQGMGVNITMPDASEVETMDASEVPSVAVDAYMYIDEEGNQSDTVDVVFSVTPAGSDEAATMGDVLVEGGKVRVIADFLSAGLNVACSVEPTENGGSARFDFYYNDIYLGFAAVCDNQADATAVDGYIFLMDAENPVLSNHATISKGGELTLSASGEGKTVLTMAEMTAEDAGEMISGVGMDFLLNGAGALISQAAQLMPDEVGVITSLLMGMSSADDEPAA